MKFEYDYYYGNKQEFFKRYGIPYDPENFMQSYMKLLNSRGQYGWELVHFHQTTHQIELIFKRAQP